MKKIAALAIALLLPFAVAAQPSDINIDINNPMTVVIKHSMHQRHSRLVYFYEPGVIGVKKDGDIAVRDYSRLQKLATRQIAEKLIDAENADRKELIAAIAVANGRRSEALPEVRALMAKHWAAEMKSGWWIQDEQGNWIKKP